MKRKVLLFVAYTYVVWSKYFHTRFIYRLKWKICLALNCRLLFKQIMRSATVLYIKPALVYAKLFGNFPVVVKNNGTLAVGNLVRI